MQILLLLIAYLCEISSAALELNTSSIHGLKIDSKVKFSHVPFPIAHPKGMMNILTNCTVFHIGSKTLVRINMTNNSPFQKTLISVRGFVTDLKGVITANISTVKTSKVVKPSQMISFKYRFVPEIESGPLGFGVVCEFYDEEEIGYF